jgi:hypothetical protein
MVPIFCANVCKWKNETCETIPGIEVGGIRRMMVVVSSIIIYCKNFCKYQNVPQYSNNKKSNECLNYHY